MLQPCPRLVSSGLGPKSHESSRFPDARSIYLPHRFIISLGGRNMKRSSLVFTLIVLLISPVLAVSAGPAYARQAATASQPARAGRTPAIPQHGLAAAGNPGPLVGFQPARSMHMFIASQRGQRTAALYPESQSITPDTVHFWSESGQGHDHVAAGDFNGDGFDEYVFAIPFNDSSGPQIGLLISKIAVGGFTWSDSESKWVVIPGCTLC